MGEFLAGQTQRNAGGSAGLLSSPSNRRNGVIGGQRQNKREGELSERGRICLGETFHRLAEDISKRRGGGGGSSRL